MATLTTEGKYLRKVRRKVRLWLLFWGLFMVVGVGACSVAELEPLFSGPLPVTREVKATETLPGLRPAPSVTPSAVQFRRTRNKRIRDTNGLSTANP